MDTLAALAHGFAVALTSRTWRWPSSAASSGPIIGALPGLGPSNGVAILIPLAFSLGLQATPGHDPPDQRLLRLHVWRAHLVHPAQHPGRRAGDDDLPRRPSHGPQRASRRSARHLGARLLRGLVLRHLGPRVPGAATGGGGALVRAGGIFRPVHPCLRHAGRILPRATRPRRRLPPPSGSASPRSGSTGRPGSALFLRRGTSLRRHQLPRRHRRAVRACRRCSCSSSTGAKGLPARA